jgi:predicted Fe-S protein YdhL (DUF1289 family)
VAHSTRPEAGIRCRWCGASIPVSNVWICETDVVALCAGCRRLSQAADGAGLAMDPTARRLGRLLLRRRPRKPVDASPQPS